MSKEYKGKAVVGGVGTGKVKIIDCSCPEFKIREVEDSDRELGRFVRALKTFCDNCRKEIEYIEENIGHNEAVILNSHITMTHDLALQTELISKISDGMCAEQATCEITGSSDSSVKNVVPNDISKIIGNSKVSKVFCNGALSHKMYMKYIFPDTKIEAVKLPSTSPANAAYSLDKLIEEWKIIKEYL